MVALDLALRNDFSIDIYDRGVECLGAPITNFLDGSEDDLFVASYRYKCPLRAVVRIVMS